MLCNLMVAKNINERSGEMKMADSKMKKVKPFSTKNLNSVADQSGVYELLNRNGEVTYVGSAGAGRLKKRLSEHLNSGDIPGASQFRVRLTTGTAEARALEKKYIKKMKPKHNDKNT